MACWLTVLAAYWALGRRARMEVSYTSQYPTYRPDMRKLVQTQVVTGLNSLSPPSPLHAFAHACQKSLLAQSILFPSYPCSETNFGSILQFCLKDFDAKLLSFKATQGSSVRIRQVCVAKGSDLISLLCSCLYSRKTGHTT